MESFKRWLYIFVALVMIGAAVLLIVFRKDQNSGEGRKTSEAEIYTGTFTELVLEAGACEIEIVTGAAGQATVKYENIKSSAYSASYENGVLKVKYTPENSWMDIFDFNGRTEIGKIILTIPEETVLDKVSMKFGAAEITAGQILAKVLEIEVGAGEMNAEYLYAEASARLTVGAGALYADRVKLTDAELDCGVGEMEFSGEIYGNSVAECGLGELTILLTTEEATYFGKLECGLGELSFGQNFVKGSGKKEYGTSSAENRMDIKCGVGEVDVHFD